MALALTNAQREALRGPVAIRVLLDVYLDSGRFSFWDGDAHAPYNGATYLAAGAFGSVSPISLSQDLGAEGIAITLDGTRLLQAQGSTDDPAALLATIGDENYQQRRIEIAYAFFSIETGALILSQRRFAGLIDQITISDEPASDDGAGGATLLMQCESIARRYGRRVGRIRSHEDQQEIWPGDNFYRFKASTLSSERRLLWGRRGPTPNQAPAGGGVIDRGGHWAIGRDGGNTF